jgi:hypothetical protein
MDVHKLRRRASRWNGDCCTRAEKHDVKVHGLDFGVSAESTPFESACLHWW